MGHSSAARDILLGHSPRRAPVHRYALLRPDAGASRNAHPGANRKLIEPDPRSIARDDPVIVRTGQLEATPRADRNCRVVLAYAAAVDTALALTGRNLVGQFRRHPPHRPQTPRLDNSRRLLATYPALV